MKDKLTKNLNLKIIAVLFAAGLWMISININDPYQSKDYSVTVQLLNMNVMTSAGKYVEVKGNSDDILVRVRGNRSVMDSFSASNIVATADLNKIDEYNRIPIEITTIETTGDKIESIRSNDSYLEVEVENIRRVQKQLEVITRNEPADGYILGKVSTEQNALRISGPESAVALVDKAVVNFDLSNATDDVSMILPVELYDAEGKRIQDSRLGTSLNEVQCVATILATKEIPLTYSVKGTAAEGYQYTGKVESSPETVLVAAKNNILKSINKLEIKDPLDVDKVKSNVVWVVDLKEYLPENVILADKNFNGKAKITAYVEEIFAKEVEISTEDIQIVNIPEGSEAEIEKPEENIFITIKGYESGLAQFNEEDIKVKVDVLEYMNQNNIMELQPGSYTMSLQFTLAEDIWMEEEMQTQIIIFNKE